MCSFITEYACLGRTSDEGWFCYWPWRPVFCLNSLTAQDSRSLTSVSTPEMSSRYLDASAWLILAMVWGNGRMFITLAACVRENHVGLFASGVFRSQQSESRFPCTIDEPGEVLRLSIFFKLSHVSVPPMASDWPDNMHFCGLFGACALHFIVWTVMFNVKENKCYCIIMVFCATDLIADILYSLDF